MNGLIRHTEIPLPGMPSGKPMEQVPLIVEPLLTPNQPNSQLQQDLINSSTASGWIKLGNMQNEILRRGKAEVSERMSKLKPLGEANKAVNKSNMNSAKDRAKAWQTIQQYMPPVGGVMTHIR